MGLLGGTLQNASAGTYTFDVRVDDAVGNFVVSAFTLPVSDFFDLNGIWRFTIDVTQAFGTCSGEENRPPDPVDITIVATSGDTLTASGFLGEPTNSLDGRITIVGQQERYALNLSGCYPEDRGTTDTRHTLSTSQPLQASHRLSRPCPGLSLGRGTTSPT